MFFPMFRVKVSQTVNLGQAQLQKATPTPQPQPLGPGSAGPPLSVKSMVMLSLSGVKVTGARKGVSTCVDGFEET